MIEKKWNDNWKVWDERNTFALAWNVPEYAKDVNLPHDAMLSMEAYAESPNRSNTGYRDGAECVYVKTLFAPEEFRNKTVILKFEGIYMNASVFVNQQLAGKCPYGYSTFYVELNNLLQFGKDNEIRVQVKNGAMPNSRWYSGTGIYRDVYLLVSDTTYIIPDGVQVTTKDVDDEYAVLEIKTEINNRSHCRKKLRLETQILNAEDTVVASASTPVTVFLNSQELYRFGLGVENPQKWCAENPYLYSCITRLCDGETVLDENRTEIGIRKLSLDVKRGLRVNGETVKLRGACIHHDNGLLGAVSVDETELRKVRIIKEAGFNAIRMSHHPISQALLRACDRLGMYVMDETFDTWTRSKSNYDYGLYFDEWWKTDVEAMVRKDYNHPSVILYSLGNEIPEIGTIGGAAICRNMSEYLKSIDDSRFVLASINGIFAASDRMDEIAADILPDTAKNVAGESNVNEMFTLMAHHMEEMVVHPIVSERLEDACATLDIAGYNYLTSRYEPDTLAYPNRVMVGSETFPPEIARNWEIIKRLPNVIGDFTWTGWDYIGEAGVGVPGYQPGEGGFGAAFPCQLAYVGDIDITGFRRPASYFREIVFGLRKEPYITVQDPMRFGQKLSKTAWVISDSQSSWTYQGMEGKPVIVEVYCSASEVELVKNGQSLGKQPAGSDHNFTAYFETTYEPGELVAYAMDGQERKEKMILRTAAGACSIYVEEEPVENTVGLKYFNIFLKSENGEIYTNRNCEIEIEVENGTLVGFGSADPKPKYGYCGTVAKLFQGRAQAIVLQNGAQAKVKPISISLDAPISISLDTIRKE